MVICRSKVGSKENTSIVDAKQNVKFHDEYAPCLPSRFLITVMRFELNQGMRFIKFWLVLHDF